ncbi:hypothetical protein HZA96_00735 [Candidatus Woesearchaeota archaeon]|nr:hypothetical protein [Candidatus Woesearchaeota archaeon]
MPLKEPESMNELVYFSNRSIGEGKAKVWVERQQCPKCKKALMGKPKGEEGNIMIRAKEYVCPACNYTVEKQEHEDSLTASIIYTCPSCKFEGEKQIPNKRKSINGAQTLRFQCDKCDANIDITKKMKEMKAKKKKGEISEDDLVG